VAVEPPAPTVSPGRGLPADERKCDRAVDWGDHRGADAADLTLSEPQRLAGRDGLGEAQPAEVAVGLAAVMEARDRLLADVAALGERDRALVEAGLLGITESSSSMPKRGRPCSTRTISATGSPTSWHAQRRLHLVGALRVADQIDAHVRGDGDAELRARVVVLGGADREQVARAGPDQRQQRALERPLVQLDVAPSL
jgi:hypothetical protein